MNSKDIMTYVALLVPILIWGALVVVGKAPAAEYVTMLAGLIPGMGVHIMHKSTANDVAKSATTPLVSDQTTGSPQ